VDRRHKPRLGPHLAYDQNMASAPIPRVATVDAAPPTDRPTDALRLEGVNPRGTAYGTGNPSMEGVLTWAK